MSADNGIYIIRFMKEAVISYRVIHAQAIENIDYFEDDKLRDATIVQYCDDAKVWYDREKAILYAHHLADEVRKEPFFSVLEYGVSEIHLDIPYPEMSLEEANKILSDYWALPREERHR